jgi:hypothetical protein
MNQSASDKYSEKNSFNLNGIENMHLPNQFGQINTSKSKRYNEYKRI